MRLSVQRGLEHEVDRARHAAPLRQLVVQLPPAGARQRVEARAAVVRGDVPLGLNQTLPLQPVERRIERALPELQHALGPLLNPLGDAPPVHRLELQRPEHEHVERALQEISLFLGHVAPFNRRYGWMLRLRKCAIVPGPGDSATAPLACAPVLTSLTINVGCSCPWT